MVPVAIYFLLTERVMGEQQHAASLFVEIPRRRLVTAP
jgi:hypothetical protein